ncbi:MAG: hypothetical protein ABL913_04840, partial [Methyloglobulus sp.]
MASILHGNAKTTPRIRQEMQDADESLATLAARYSLNEKTVLKWTHADGVEDKKSGPATRRSVLTEVEQQAVCTVRRHLRLPLDDLYLVFKPRIPKLSRSNLHRCLQHHGLSRLPIGEDGRAPKRKASKAYPIGYLHVDITGLRTEQGKHYLFVAVDRATKYVYAELYGPDRVRTHQSFSANSVCGLDNALLVELRLVFYI